MINKHLMSAVRREKRVSPQALYQSFDRIRKVHGNVISIEEAAYIYASQLGIDVYKFLKNEPRLRDSVDLDELESIINRNTETMTPYFKGLPKDLDWLKMKIKEIYPSRNVIAHNNPLSSDDIQRVRVICRDWQKQLPALKHKLEEKTQTSINR